MISCQDAQKILEAIRENFREYQDFLDEYKNTGHTVYTVALKNKQKGIEELVAILRSEFGFSMEKAREILGKDFLGPEAVFKTWNIKLEAKDIPPVPFSIEDLERAKELGQFLILRVPLTMQKMGKLIKEPMFQDDWFKQEDFYTKDTSKPGWALVTKEVIPDSTNKNYLEQTQVICDYLDSEVFRKAIEMPKAYEDAIIEFEAKKQDLELLVQSDWRGVARQLSELQITKLTRQSPADVIYDLMVYKQSNEERLLENGYTWTSARFSVGDLVNIGHFKPGGLRVSNDTPDYASVPLGVSFARSQ